MIKSTSLTVLLIAIVVIFSLISCEGSGKSSKKSAPATTGENDRNTNHPTCDDISYTAVYDIATLKEVADDMAGNYCLTDDIDLKDDGKDSGFPLGWADDDNDITTFTGNFDGEGHTISNLAAHKVEGVNMGLFAKLGTGAGVADTSSIKNLNLDNPKVSGKQYVGALAGIATGKVSITNVKIKNPMMNATGVDDGGRKFSFIGGLLGKIEGGITVTSGSVTGGTVTGKGDGVGGLVGISTGSAIIGGHVTSTVTGIDDVGGLVGDANGSSTISKSRYVTGTVNGGNNVGGLVGYSNNSIISSSYAAGEVIGGGNSNAVGGLIGFIYKGEVSNNYATGAVSGDSGVGGFVGKIYGGTILNAYATGKLLVGGTDKGGLAGEFNCVVTAGEAVICSIAHSYFDKKANSGITAISIVASGVGTRTDLVGVNGESDIKADSVAGGYKTVSNPQAVIFSGWTTDNWKFTDGLWPILKWQE